MAGKITIEYLENDIKQLIIEDLKRKMPTVNFEKRNITIETKSKQNYRSEWEVAQFRGTIVIDGEWR